MESMKDILSTEFGKSWLERVQQPGKLKKAQNKEILQAAKTIQVQENLVRPKKTMGEQALEEFYRRQSRRFQCPVYERGKS